MEGHTDLQSCDLNSFSDYSNQLNAVSFLPCPYIMLYILESENSLPKMNHLSSKATPLYLSFEVYTWSNWQLSKFFRMTTN